jgi:hypothetical protein
VVACFKTVSSYRKVRKQYNKIDRREGGVMENGIVDNIRKLLEGDSSLCADAAMWFRHDYGLLDEHMQSSERWYVREYFLAGMKACCGGDVSKLFPAAEKPENNQAK